MDKRGETRTIMDNFFLHTQSNFLRGINHVVRRRTERRRANKERKSAVRGLSNAGGVVRGEMYLLVFCIYSLINTRIHQYLTFVYTCISVDVLL